MSTSRDRVRGWFLGIVVSRYRAPPVTHITAGRALSGYRGCQLSVIGCQFISNS
jgi:hypothetical protein